MNWVMLFWVVCWYFVLIEWVVNVLFEEGIDKVDVFIIGNMVVDVIGIVR